MKNDKFDCHKCPNCSENVISGEMINFGSINTENNTQQNDILQEPDIQTGSLKIVTQDNIGQLPEFYRIGDIYMDLILNNPKNTQILVNLSALQDIYIAGSGISIQDRVITNTKTVSWGELAGNLYNQTDLTNILGTKCNTDLSNFPNSFWEKIKSVIAHITGQEMTDDEILTQLKELKCSAFDRSKFTVVGSPNITDDGIASGFSNSNYLTLNTGITLSKDTYFKIYTRFKTPEAFTKNGRFLGRSANLSFGHTSAGKISGVFIGASLATSSLQALLTNTVYDAVLIYDNTGFYVKYKTETESTYTSTTPVEVTSDSTVELAGDIGNQTNDTTAYFTGSIYLGYFAIKVGGIPTFSGNKTGIDTYEIDGSTVTIPYTISKTGSKIVDYVYRSQVQSVYDEYGYAPYYTLSDTDFTLPQGELYGYLEKRARDMAHPVGEPFYRFSDEINDDEVRLEGAEVDKGLYLAIEQKLSALCTAGSTDDKICLPDFRNRTLWGANDFGYVEAGLPNITGHVGAVTQGSGDISGCFGNYTRASGEINNTNADADWRAAFNASWSNPIYGNSTTVQPPAVKVRWLARWK